MNKQIIELLLGAAGVVKLMHLKTKGYNHLVLGDLYDSLADGADKIAELIQGYEGLLDLQVPQATYQDPVPYLTSLREQVGSLNEQLPYSDVQNEVETIIGSISHGLYKFDDSSVAAPAPQGGQAPVVGSSDVPVQ